jgi:lipopolysaccharide/colanic/teichoic acid biosynthesis glycosyltransferase
VSDITPFAGLRDPRHASGTRGDGPHVRNWTAKRVLDLTLGTVLALCALPLILVLCVASASSLRTWPLFVQPRPGRGGRPFHIVKIRTLRPDVPRFGHPADRQGLARAPLVCRLMRATHLDELPQLLLVPIGIMSLVGPRPSQPPEYENFEAAFEQLRVSVRPGCTGLWQVGRAHDRPLSADPAYDVYYLEQGTVWMDLWLMGRTLMFILQIARPIGLGDVPAWTMRRRGAVAHFEGSDSVETPVAPL